MPAVRILDNMQLGANEYRIRIKEVDSGKGELFPGSLPDHGPQGPAHRPARHAHHRAGLRPARHLGHPAALREEASFRGFTVVDPGTVLTTHLTEVLKSHMAELLSYAETKKLLDDLPPENKKLVEELIPSQISVTGVQRVLQTLLARARLDPRPAGHPGRHRRSGRPHQERALHHRACARPPGPPALPRQPGAGRLSAADRAVAGLGTGLRRIHRRPGRGTPAGHGAVAAAAVHPDGARSASTKPAPRTKCRCC